MVATLTIHRVVGVGEAAACPGVHRQDSAIGRIVGQADRRRRVFGWGCCNPRNRVVTIAGVGGALTLGVRE